MHVKNTSPWPHFEIVIISVIFSPLSYVFSCPSSLSHVFNYPSALRHIFRLSPDPKLHSKYYFSHLFSHHDTPSYHSWPWATPLDFFRSYRFTLSLIFRLSSDLKSYSQNYFSYPFGHHDHAFSSLINIKLCP